MAVREFSIAEALDAGLKGTKENLVLLVGVGLLFMVNLAVTEAIYAVSSLIVDFGVYIVSFIVDTFLLMGLLKISLKIIDTGEASFSDLFVPLPLFVNYLVASIVTGILVMIGAILLLIPGIYIALVLFFALYVVVDEKAGPIEALQRSAILSKGIRLKLFLLLLVLIGICLAGFLACGVGLLVAGPMSYLVSVHAYRQVNPGGRAEGEAIENL